MENIPQWFIDLIEMIYAIGYDGGSFSNELKLEFWNEIKENIKESN